MAPTASTLYKQQSRYKGKLTREYASTGLGTIYWSSTETLGITAGWFQLDAENTKGEEVFITGITGTTAEYSGTVSIRGLRTYGADTNVSGNQYVHRVTASIIVSDNHSWTDQMITAFLAHEQLAGAFHGFTGIGTDAARPAAEAGNAGMIYWSTDGLIMYYSNGTTWTAQAAGTQPDATITVKGVSKMSVAPASAASPIAVGDNDPRMISSANVTDLTDGGDSTLHYHATDRARANHTGTQSVSTLLESGTAGETLAADQLVYLKSSDSKLYKASKDVTTDANSWNAIGIIVTGGAANATVTYKPLVGTITLTTPLTANTKYFLSTAGALTTTVPVNDSATIIPYAIGTTDSAGRLNVLLYRQQRMIVNQIVNTFATSPTITVGFPILYAQCWTGSNANPGYNGTGYYNATSGVQYANINVSGVFAQIISSAGGAVNYAASVVSNNLKFTGTGATLSNAWLITHIYEAL